MVPPAAREALDGGNDAARVPVAARVPLRATSPIDAVSIKALIREEAENGTPNRRDGETATATRLRLDVLTSQNRALSLRFADLAVLHTKTSTERDGLRAALLEAETVCAATVAGNEVLRRALGVAAEEAKVAFELADNAAAQIAIAAAVTDEADARAEMAEAEVERLRAFLELAETEKNESGKQQATARRTAAGAATSSRNSDKETNSENPWETVRAVQLDMVREQHVAAMRLGELELKLSKWKKHANAESLKKAVAETDLSDLVKMYKQLKEQFVCLTRELEEVRCGVAKNEALVRHELATETRVAEKHEALSDARCQSCMGNQSAKRGELADTARCAQNRESIAMREIATRLARDVSEAIEFGLHASAIALPTDTQRARDEDHVGNTPRYWYDAGKDEIVLLGR